MPLLESFPPGTVVGGDFRVLHAIGQGGMGVVFAAEQLSTGKRRALKVMMGSRTHDPELRRRFEQEARVGALIRSEHVVDVIAAGVEPASGLPWLAMELLEGEDLGACLRRRGSLLPSETRDIVAQLCHALAAAHAIPLVHRDLKPENVFLARARREGAGNVTVKILDFGIAKLVSPDASSTTGAVGTPLWMAPEQASVDRPVTPATDVWALGLLVFQMLTGDLYWCSPSSPMALMKELLFEPLEGATARAAQRGAESRVPPGFDPWFGRCVVREPEARFATAGDAWASLASVLASAPDPPPAATRALGVSPDAATLEAIGSPHPPKASAPTPRASSTASTTLGRTVHSATPPPATGRAGTVGVVLGAIALLIALAVGLGEILGFRSWPRGPAGERARDAGNTRDTQTGEMKLIPGGTFQMGSDDMPPERPRHTVMVSPFYLDVTEVTVRAYRGCVLADKCPRPLGGVHSNFEDGREDHPMNWIDWNAGRSFCEWADKRLPSEAEWEYAAQGTVWRSYPWGNDAPGEGVCWKRASLGTCAAGSSPKDRSPFGVVDMAGNVSEWTSSRFCPYTTPECPFEEQPTRVARGGSWSNDQAITFTNQFRFHTLEVAPNPYVGVRCARDAR